MAAEPIRLDGQVAIVTGAGHGLGRSYALALAARGASVVCNDVDGPSAEEVAQEIVAVGGAAVAETSSVASPGAGEAIVRTAVETFGSIEVVINNAGQLRTAAFIETRPETFREILDTHLVGAFAVTQPAFRHMAVAGYGRIVFTSSNVGVFGSPWQASYAAAKAGIVGLCNTVALEGEPLGIRANVIMPMALTGMSTGGGPPFPPEQMRDTVDALRPMARHLTVENVAPLVVYLASRRCEETHMVFSVGGGHVANVFTATTRGWYAPGLVDITPEQVEANLAMVKDPTGFAVPRSSNDECRIIAANLP